MAQGIVNISICMATYNGAIYIQEQLNSIMPQLGLNDEIIISDDGSTDDTLAVISRYSDERIKIVHNRGKRGPNSNFENALGFANGKYIFLADQDDIWLPNKISVMLEKLKEFDLVICDCKVVDKNLNVLSDSYFEHRNSGSGFFKNLIGNTYMGNCIAFKKELLSLALPFPNNIPNHDIWLGTIADLFFKPYFLREVLSLHRRHQANASNTFDVIHKTTFLEKINKRLSIVVNLPMLFYKKIKI